MFGQKRVQPATVPGDEIIALEPQNAHWMMRAQLWSHMFKYDDVLDPAVLKDALLRLQERGRWRLLGARLRKDANGNVFYHVPRKFTAERPGIGFTEKHLDMSINDHEEGRLIPHCSVGPAIYDPCEYNSLRFSESAPASHHDFFFTDAAQLHAHVVVFRDATVVSVQYLHSLMDVVGCSDFLFAWSLLVNGRDKEVSEVIEYNPLITFGQNTKPEDYMLYSSINTGFTFVGMIFGFIWSAVKYKSQSEKRNIFLPKAFVDGLRKEALEELKGSEHPFVSDADIIISWLLKTTLQQDDETLRRPKLTMVQPIALRGMLAQDFVPKGKAYLGNALGGLVSTMRQADILNKPLSWTAAQLRKAVREQGTRPQQEALFKYDQGRQIRGVKLPLSIGDPASAFFGVTNWIKAGMFDIDFSRAVVKPSSSATQRIPSGLPTMVTSGKRNDASINGGIITGQDRAGDYWILAAFRKVTWQGIMRQVEAGEVARTRIAKL